MILSHTTLREANIARLPQFKTPEGKPAHLGPECPHCKGSGEWVSAFEFDVTHCIECDGTGRLPADGSDWSIDDWLLALGGEVGELLNYLTKVRRGDAVDLADVGREIADCYIYLDLYRHRAGFPGAGLSPYPTEPTHEYRYTPDDPAPLTALGNDLQVHVGKLVEKATSHHVFKAYGGRVYECLAHIATALGLDVGEIIALKFNEASHRVGADVFIVDDVVGCRVVRPKRTEPPRGMLSRLPTRIVTCGECHLLYDAVSPVCPRCALITPKGDK